MPRKVVNGGITWGPYSSAAIAGGFCYVTGQAGIDPATNEPVGGGIKRETEQTMNNIKNVLELAGYTLDDVVKVNCYLRDWDDWDAMNEVYTTYFPTDPPARAAVEIGKMAPGLHLEIECIAWKES